MDQRAHPTDPERQQWLQELQLLDGEADPALDRFARMAARAAGVPIGLVTFLAQGHQQVAGMHGWQRRSTSLLESFCRLNVRDTRATVLGAAAGDPR